MVPLSSGTLSSAFSSLVPPPKDCKWKLLCTYTEEGGEGGEEEERGKRRILKLRAIT